jgi:ectoine hydroxylase-related dioxygenase (phytanoyl-CoA dioxygenase family)
MPFMFDEQMPQQYRDDGYVILRQIIPPSLVGDMRRVLEDAPALARENGGPQAQRLQPLVKNGIEMKPFEDLAALPELVAAIASVLSPEHRFGLGGFDRLGVFVEPAEKPSRTDWHRDCDGLSMKRTGKHRALRQEPYWFNQVNIPLLEDTCTWYVPGSYARDDTPEEPIAAAPPTFADDASYEELERGHLDYSRAMPGAIRVSMDAGDFLLYHPDGWHIGVYLPDRRRLTLHDYAPTPELKDWYQRAGWTE